VSPIDEIELYERRVRELVKDARRYREELARCNPQLAHDVAALERACPACGVRAGRRCLNENGREMIRAVHAERRPRVEVGDVDLVAGTTRFRLR
jgi:hypothetical protein